jgi:hypothetical protein
MTLESRALAEMEHGLASRRYALAERAVGLWRARSHFQPTPSQPNFNSAQSVDVVDSALEAGALESVVEALEGLCAQLPRLPVEARGRACRVAVDALLMLGERHRALELALASRAELEGSAQGVGRLECLGLASGFRCADGKWNLLGMSLRLRERSLDATALAEAMGTSPGACLATPELSLLLFNALWPREPQRALESLNRFSRAYGLRERFQLDPAEEPHDLLAVLRNRARFGARGPLVSVVVAAYNAAATLGYALDSLLAQTHAALEILVADDGSTDETAEVMKRYAREPRVRLFRSEANQGAYNVRNQLAARARGEFLAFHDADDWALPCRVATQLRALQTTSARGSLASLLRVGPAGEVRFFKNQRAVRLSRISLLLRRETFVALGGFRSVRVGGDYELAEKLSSTCGERALVRSKAPLMLSRFAPGSATASLGTESAEDGYSAPLRRAYSQLVFERYRAGRAVSNERFEQRLRETNNWLAPTALRPF